MMVALGSMRLGRRIRRAARRAAGLQGELDVGWRSRAEEEGWVD